MARLVTLKPEVKPANLVILAAACNAAADLGISITVTSGNDSVHMKNSKHYSNEALDLRTKDMTKKTKRAFMDNLQDRLGPRYQLILESEGKVNEHLHCELDPK